MTIDTLLDAVKKYKECSHAHGEASKQGDYKITNKNYYLLIEAYLIIKSYGEEGEKLLIDLFNDENDSVRCWAATHSLEINESKAIKILKKLKSGKGIIAFNAEMVLSEWKKGRLKLP